MLPHSFAVTSWRATDIDAFGDVLDSVEHSITGCGLLHHSTEENTDRRQQVTETATLVAPPDADLDPADELDFPDGSRWHVTGRPHTRSSPLSGWQPALIAPIRKVTG